MAGPRAGFTENKHDDCNCQPSAPGRFRRDKSGKIQKMRRHHTRLPGRQAGCGRSIKERTLCLPEVALAFADLNTQYSIMDIYTALQLLDLGFEISEQMRLHRTKIEQQKTDEQVIEFGIAIRDSMNSLQNAITLIGEQIIEKIEADKFEQFQSRIQNMEMLVQMGNTKDLFSYALQLKESVDYARNRVNEGKFEWIAAYLTGLPLFALAVKIQGWETTKYDDQFAQELDIWRNNTLNAVMRAWLDVDDDLPWPLIKNVLNGVDGSPGELSKLIESQIEATEDANSTVDDRDKTYCPRGHGLLRLWQGKQRCWRCGWPEK